MDGCFNSQLTRAALKKTLSEFMRCVQSIQTHAKNIQTLSPFKTFCCRLATAFFLLPEFAFAQLDGSDRVDLGMSRGIIRQMPQFDRQAGVELGDEVTTA